MPMQETFGRLVFDKLRMKKKLPHPVYQQWKNAIRKEDVLDRETADAIAHAMKEWAIENGATHYSHYFFPLHGRTAKKHESFLDRGEDQEPILRFSGRELIKGEPDASSFPSGGLRATFEARGYTYWDASSYAFILDHVLYIPSVFVSYSGETLDLKGPLHRSHDLCSQNATRVLNALSEQHTWRVRSMVGMEQEYFLLDRSVYLRRRDLRLCGKTVIGAPPVKGQSLEDHYLGAIPARVLRYMDSVNELLWELGVYAKTSHNEVAPCQFELAPLFEHCNVAIDDNHMIMEVLQKTAREHDLVCLLHEKPFAGQNGSGKHNNWSLVSNFGENCFDPGDDPACNTRFLLFMSAVVEAVDRWQHLFRYSGSNPGNDYRLGGCEAPPTVLSITLGQHIEAIVEAIVNPQAEPPVCDRALKVSYLESVPYDDADRNRTSPFAFTGNKFEFRMPGASRAASEVNIALNAAVGHVLGEYATRLEHAMPEERKACADAIVKEALTKHRRILFNGDGYGEEWEREAEKRGLTDIRSHYAALGALRADDVQTLFTTHGIYTKKELEALYEVCVEEFVHVRLLEMRALADTVQKDVIPALTSEMRDLGATLAVVENAALRGRLETLSDGATKLFARLEDLDTLLVRVEAATSFEDAAQQIDADALKTMQAVRDVADALEPIVSAKNWTVPTYDELFASL